MAYVATLNDVITSTLRLGVGERGAVGVTSAVKRAMSLEGSRCPGNCSGHGSCQGGQCVCLVQFSGGTCHEINIGYYIAFGTIFLLLGCVALVQLVLCVVYDYNKTDKRSWRSACQVTVQKLLYVLVICATALRGAYFFIKWQVSEEAASGLWSAYFPVIISGFSLIVCFWAEAFHLSTTGVQERPFLSKSAIFFIAFNVLQYILLAIQLVLAEAMDTQDDKKFVLRICNGGFALLMIVVVVFFLIYGVEVYFKVHGAFRVSNSVVDTWQLHMSRLGLVAQAVLQLITALFLVSDVASEQWKHNMPVLSQNFYDIGFRMVEFGVALWFPCVLWNCLRPEELWVLNPKRIFRSFDFRRSRLEVGGSDGGVPGAAEGRGQTRDDDSGVCHTDSGVPCDCWICYDPGRQDMGPLIQPCLCKGDVASVHHDCLKKWLVESAADGTCPRCRVCGEQYRLEVYHWLPKGLRPRHWLQTFVSLLLLFTSPLAAYALCHSLPASSNYWKALVIGTTVLLELLSLRLFVVYVHASCKRAKVATMKIVSRSTTHDPSHQPPITTAGAEVVDTQYPRSEVMVSQCSRSEVRYNHRAGSEFKDTRDAGSEVMAAEGARCEDSECGRSEVTVTTVSGGVPCDPIPTALHLL